MAETTTFRYLELETNGNVSSNVTNLGRDEDLAKIEIAIQVVIFTLAVCGNGVVLIVLLRRR